MLDHSLMWLAAGYAFGYKVVATGNAICGLANLGLAERRARDAVGSDRTGLMGIYLGCVSRS